MDQKIKRIILLIAIICILLISIICILIFIQKNQDQEIKDEETVEGAYDFESDKINVVQSRSDYYIVQKCVEMYYRYMLSDNTEENLKKLSSLIDEECTEKPEEIKKGLPYNNYNQIKIDINKMYVNRININISMYLVYGNIIDTTKNTTSNFAVGVKLDSNNNTFSILTYKYLQEKGLLNIDESKVVQLKQIDKIENKEYNIFKKVYITEEEYVKYIFETFINRMLYNIEEAYSNLDSTYSNKRFENLQNFKKYAESNKDLYLSFNNSKQYGDFNDMYDYMEYLYTHKTLELSSYQVKKYDDYTQYVCIDQNNNYYIFREKSIMQYTVILDTYTIDLPEFTEKYESAKDEEKVLLNIQKCFEAINNKDYNYVYNKLDQTFKNNNFKTLADFEKYMKDNTFDSNTVSSSNGKVQGNTYMYDITIKDSSGKDTNTIKKTFVMQLKEGTDFVMSFGV